jgi:beta-glucosidase
MLVCGGCDDDDGGLPAMDMSVPDMTKPPGFPASFMWGAGTSAYQVEGGITNNDWAAWENLGGKIANNDKAGRADDHYTFFDADLAQAKAMGHNSYRFSIEWARIEPTQGNYDQAQIDHYKAVVAACKKHGLKPVVTLMHFTLPEWVNSQKAGAVHLGGWGNAATVTAFVAFADRVVSALADDVELWITFNEPMVFLVSGYFYGEWPPGTGLDFPGAEAAMLGMIDAHAKAYDKIHAIYSAKAKPVQVTIAHHHLVFDPKTPGADDAATMQVDHLFNHVFLTAVTEGKVEKFDGSSTMKPEYMKKLDLLGLNYYRHNLVETNAIGPLKGLPAEDGAAKLKSDIGWELYPKGMSRALMTLWTRYKLPILITENGLADATDKQRPWFLVQHLLAVQEAITAGVDVRGYLHWSLFDNFEWALGFAPRFGLQAVDYADANLKRTPRASAALYTQIIQAARISPELVAQYPTPSP